MAVDHCFALRGQGTILTGTLLQVCHRHPAAGLSQAPCCRSVTGTLLQVCHRHPAASLSQAPCCKFVTGTVLHVCDAPGRSCTLPVRCNTTHAGG
jgi:hypothetical protein